MTVIAYRNGVLAADSQVTWHTHRDGITRKIFKVGGILVAASGSHEMAIAFTDWVRRGMTEGRQPTMSKPGAVDGQRPSSASGYIFRPDGLIICLTELGWTTIRTDVWAGGSGCDYAYGAMAVGASAEEAVRAAIRFDIGCGGDVTVLRH